MARSCLLLTILWLTTLALSACDLVPGLSCKFCGTPTLTDKVRTPEGFDTCKPCDKDAVRDLRTAQTLVAQVRKEVVSLGVKLPWGAIPMKLGKPANAQEWGHCEALRYGNGTVASLSMRFMPGMPRPVFKAVAAHELTHAWAYLHRSPGDQEVALSEGAPTFVEYTYLARDKSTAGQHRRKQLITNKHKAYGGGARRLQAYADGHGGVAGVLAVLKTGRTIPKGF